MSTFPTNDCKSLPHVWPKYFYSCCKYITFLTASWAPIGTHSTKMASQRHFHAAEEDTEHAEMKTCRRKYHQNLKYAQSLTKTHGTPILIDAISHLRPIAVSRRRLRPSVPVATQACWRRDAGVLVKQRTTLRRPFLPDSHSLMPCLWLELTEAEGAPLRGRCWVTHSGCPCAVAAELEFRVREVNEILRNDDEDSASERTFAN